MTMAKTALVLTRHSTLFDTVMVSIATPRNSVPRPPRTPRTVLTANPIVSLPVTWVGALEVRSAPLPVQ
jgi:hypothetical protein